MSTSVASNKAIIKRMQKHKIRNVELWLGTLHLSVNDLNLIENVVFVLKLPRDVIKLLSTSEATIFDVLPVTVRIRQGGVPWTSVR